MPKEKTTKGKLLLCMDDLRHNEYYGMQETFDNLYARAKNGEVFTDLMSIVLKRENILLAYRKIKTNTGSNTAGTDGLKIKDIGRLSPEEVVEKVRFILTGSKHGYRPRPVRRVEIPKPNGDMRPLGIPCIWDRLVQQCIKQVMERKRKLWRCRRTAAPRRIPRSCARFIYSLCTHLAHSPAAGAKPSSHSFGRAAERCGRCTADRHRDPGGSLSPFR